VEVTVEELRAVEALRHTSTLISLFDPSGVAAFANPAAFAAYGDPKYGFVDRFADPERGAEALAEVLAGETLAELRLVRTVDGERWHHLDALQVIDPVTGHASALLSERDVTAQVEAERALAAAHERVEVAEVKQRFLANISHELRTPLTAVTGFAELLATGDLAPAQAEQVRRIREGGARLAELINNMIDVSELDRGDMRLQVAPFEPGRLLETLLEAARPAADAKGLSLKLELAAGAIGPLLGDADKIAKVVGHYLSNAVKFTARGGVTLKLEARDDGDAAAIAICVTDTGPGLDAATRSRLFRRFHQADDSLRKSIAGGGLGLAISKELATLMDGEVGVDSAPGEGARFWLRLRLSPADARVGAAGSDVEAGDETPIRVLYADDHESNRVLVQALLRSQGCLCDLVCDGAEAVAAVRGGAYDLVLMDIQMPVQDGLSAAREIRALPCPQSEVPILALTANTLADQREAYAAAGMQDCIAKPVNLAELITKTAQWATAAQRGDDQGERTAA
jgi:signal transduction histidine kinase/ActR/RegA family two-component response regulator